MCFVLFVSSFVMIIYLVRANEVAGVEKHLEYEELSVRIGKGFKEL